MYEEEKRGPDLTAQGTLIVRVCVDRLNFGPVRRRLLLAFFFWGRTDSSRLQRRTQTSLCIQGKHGVVCYSLRPEKHVATVFLRKSPSGLSDRTRGPIVSSASSLSSTSSPATPATSRSSSTPRRRAAPPQPRADPPLPRAAPPLPRAAPPLPFPASLNFQAFPHPLPQNRRLLPVDSPLPPPIPATVERGEQEEEKVTGAITTGESRRRKRDQTSGSGWWRCTARSLERRLRRSSSASRMPGRRSRPTRPPPRLLERAAATTRAPPRPPCWPA